MLPILPFDSEFILLGMSVQNVAEFHNYLLVLDPNETNYVKTSCNIFGWINVHEHAYLDCIFLSDMYRVHCAMPDFIQPLKANHIRFIFHTSSLKPIHPTIIITLCPVTVNINTKYWSVFV